MRKMKHADNQINLDPILFPMSLFMSFTALSNQCGCRSVGLALGERANPKVEWLNATEGSG